jgi:hypothetical protein
VKRNGRGVAILVRNQLVADIGESEASRPQLLIEGFD